MGVQNQRKIQNKMKFLKKLKQIYNSSPVLQDEEVTEYLKDIQIKFQNIQHFVLPPSIKYQTTFLLLVKNSMFLRFYMKLGCVVNKVIFINL